MSFQNIRPQILACWWCGAVEISEFTTPACIRHGAYIIYEAFCGFHLFFPLTFGAFYSEGDLLCCNGTCRISRSFHRGPAPCSRSLGSRHFSTMSSVLVCVWGGGVSDGVGNKGNQAFLFFCFCFKGRVG